MGWRQEMTDRDTGEVRSLPRYTSAGIEDHSEWHVNARDHDEAVATLRARVSELDDHYRMAAAAAKSSGDEVERLTYALRFRRKLHREAKVRASWG